MPRPSKGAYKKTFKRKLLSPKAAKVAGLPELYEKLNALGEDLEGDEVNELLLKCANVAKDEVRSMAPYAVREGNREAKRRGERWLHIRDAVYASLGDQSKDKRGPSAIVGMRGKNAPQAYWIEKGTSRMPAQPFFRPAIAAVRPQIASMLADGLKSIINRVSGGK